MIVTQVFTQVFTNLSEYSRYHSGTTPDRPDLSVIVATIEVASPVAGEVLTVALWRLDGYGAVCTKKATLATATSYIVSFDLNVDGYDALGIYRAKQGDYSIQVTDPVGVVTASAMFAVSIVPVWELKNEWTKGVTFWDYEVLMPRVQPQNITGITVTECSENHYKGSFVLAYTAPVGSNPGTLSWGGGPTVNINGTLPASLLLINSQQDFVMVDVAPLSLPAGNAQDSLYIDNGRMKDTAIIDQMRRATDWVQQKIVTKIEPSIVDTDPALNGWADEVGMPETYYRPRTFEKWMSFKIPYPNLLDLSSVTGWFNTSQSAVVPREWLVWNEKTGIVELVPATNATVVWTFYNSIFAMYYILNFPSIPSFWHYRATVGLRDLLNERAIVREAIAKKCAFELLNSAGSAYRAGYSSQSASRDGVSQGQSYTSSATYGVYGGHFNSYKEWLATEIPKIRSRFCGIQYVTI